MAANRRTQTARAYYRIAAKAARAGQYQQAEHWRKVADRLTDEVRRDRERRAERAAAEAAWRAKRNT